MFAIALSFLLIARVQLSDAFAMAPVTRGNMCRLVSSSRTILFDTSMEKERRMGELTKPEQKVFDIMEAIHNSKYLFRVVVVGKGAILETTTELGPVMKVTQSPSTGANLMTFASKDQSTEFHLQLSNVYKIVITENETPAKVLRM